MVGTTTLDKEELGNMWEFIMRASMSYDLYGKGQERVLIDRASKGIVFYYRLDNNLTII